MAGATGCLLQVFHVSHLDTFSVFTQYAKMRRGLRTGDGSWADEVSMYLQKIFDPAAHAYRVRYAIANILRDRVAHEGAFTNCLELEDADEVICAILRRGLKNQKLRAALRKSHLINLNDWLVLHPEFSEAYYAPEQSCLRQHNPGSRRWNRRRT